MKTRQSNIELLRIIAMLYIVLHHFVYWNETPISSISVSPEKFFLELLYSGGKIGLNIFLIISGYFYDINKNMNVKKILKFVLKLTIYSSVLSFVFFDVLKLLDFSDIKIAGIAFMPVISATWGFATHFVLIMALMPFLSKGVEELTANEHYKLLLFVVISYTFMCYFKHNAEFFFGWYIFLYLAGAYIKKYDILPKITTSFIALILGYVLTIIMILFCNFKNIDVKYVFATQSPNIILISFAMFFMFLKINIKENKYINLIGKHTFGVFLIHDFVAVRFILWRIIFTHPKEITIINILTTAIVASICIFAISVTIDVLIDFVITKLFFLLPPKQDKC